MVRKLERRYLPTPLMPGSTMVNAYFSMCSIETAMRERTEVFCKLL